MRPTIILALVLVAVPAAIEANPESIKRRIRAYELAYNLDYEEASREMEAAAKADPRDPGAERGLAVIPWLLISHTRGAATVDEYLGSLSKENVALRAPPAALKTRFATHADNALKLAEELVKARPNDPAVLYELGAIVALRAAYVATIDGKVISAFKSARRAYQTNERVLELDPSRTDAGLVVGTYQYVAGSLSPAMRMLAWIGGISGGKASALRLIEAAAASRTEASADAKFALVLLYNRERRYDDAQRTLGDLQQLFGKNQLLWLEAGATALRAGRAADAETYLTTGLKMSADDTRPRMFGEEALFLQKRGAARVTLKRPAEAETDLQRALTLDSRKWVKGRVHAELGKLADLRSERKTASSHFKQAEQLAYEDNDATGRHAAKRWIRKAYRP
jgi:tetratricopeptide (TPR) repeat protein